MRTSSRPRLAALLLAIHVASCAHSIAERVAKPPRRQYLVPFMWHGPNNQINAIKETLGLAMLLGRTLALPDLHSHLSSDHTMAPIKYEDMFDLEYLMDNADVVLLSDLFDQTDRYKGTLDATIALAKKVLVDELAHQMRLRMPEDKGLWFESPVSAIRGCHHEQIDQLRRMLKPYDVVGVQTYHSLVWNTHMLAGPVGPDCADSSCCHAYREASRLVRQHPDITAAARRFVRQRIGRGEAFVAAHIRPFPDPCVELWLEVQNGTVPEQEIPKAMLETCNNEYLYDRFAPSIKSLMVEYETSKVFIMVHPLLRPLVLSKLHAEGVAPIFINFEDVARYGLRTGGSGENDEDDDEGEEEEEEEEEEEAVEKEEEKEAGASHATVSVTLLAMVEEAVCEIARAFVGTKESSMTATVMQDRMDQGQSLDHMYTFTRWEGYERRPIALPHYYADPRTSQEAAPAQQQQQQQPALQHKLEPQKQLEQEPVVYHSRRRMSRRLG